MNDCDAVLTFHIRLDTAGGKILEVRDRLVIHGAFDELDLRTAEATVAASLDAGVLSPARGMVRAHVNKLLDKVSYRRLGGGERVPKWPQDSAIVAGLEETLQKVTAR